jgi:hypothetical protein
MTGNGHYHGYRTCPTPQDLSAFQVGNLPRDTLEGIATHLGTCESCLLALERLDDVADGLVSELRMAGSPEALSESECRRVAALVEDLGVPEAVPDPPAPGALGQYELLEELGLGGMGRVFKARHRLMDRVVALKILRGRGLGRPGALSRFRQEIRALARLDHPHIVRAHDADQAGGLHFLVMEYVAGIDLRRRVREQGPLPVAEACACICQAAAGLQHAHDQGLIHRDVKPANLIRTADGQVKVLDLGVALLAADGPESDLVVGTADYMAPEQWEPVGTLDGRADVYGLGCTLYCLLTGRPPFEGPEYGTWEQKHRAHASVPPPPVRALRPDVPAGLAAVLERMLAKDPADRYASPGAVGNALRPFAAPARPPRRRKLLPHLAALAALGVVAALALAVSAGLRQPAGSPGLQVVSLRVSHYRGEEARLLGDLGLTSFAARREDDVRVQARLSRPAYCYLIALNPDGKEQLRVPPDETVPPVRRDALDYPADPDTYFGLTDGAGMQAFVLLAAREPLPAYAAWKSLAGTPPWQRFEAEGVWQLDGGRFRRLDVSRGQERVHGVPPPLQALTDFLRRTGADAVGAVAFPVQP